MNRAAASLRRYSPGTARRAVLGLAATALAAGLLPAAALPAAAAADPLARYHHQHLTWKSCLRGPDDAMGKELEQAGARCADVTVPLDYGRPHGRTVSVAISRIRATDGATASARCCSTAADPAGRRSVTRRGCGRR